MKIAELDYFLVSACILLLSGCTYADPVATNEKADVASVADSTIGKSSDEQFAPEIYFIEGLSDPRYGLIREDGPLFSNVKIVSRRHCPTRTCNNPSGIAVYQYDKHGRLIHKTYEPSGDGWRRVWKYEYLSDDLPYPSVVTDESVESGVLKRTRTEYKRDRSNNIISDREVKTEGYYFKGISNSNVISDRVREWGWRKKDSGYARTTEHGDDWYYVNGLPKSRTNKRGKLDYQFSYSFDDDGNISESSRSILRADKTKSVTLRKNDVIGRPSSERQSRYDPKNRLWKDGNTKWQYLETDPKGNWTHRERCTEKKNISKAGVETQEYKSCRWTRREIQYW